MSREKILESIILKKQDFSEADQIVTVFSKEEGKLRCLVKAAKLPTSKLHPVLQPLFLSRVTLANGSTTLPKVIRGQAIESFGEIFSEEHKLSAWFVVSEFLIRALPDGQPNPQLFDLTRQYLQFLNTTDLNPVSSKISLTQFQIKAMDELGLGIHLVSRQTSGSTWFSMDKGGFFDEGTGSDSFQVNKESYDLFILLKDQAFELAILAEDQNDVLFKLVNRFVTYQLEREIKSSKFV